MAAGPCRWMASRRTFASSPSDRAPRRWWRSALARVRGGSERRQVLAAPLAIRAILARFAERLRTGQAQTRRLKNLPAHLGEDLARSASLGPILAPPRREPAPRAGVFTSSGEKAALLAALPFGRCDAGLLERAAGWSERHGTGELRLSPWRGLALAGVAQADIPLLTAEARRARADPRPRRSPSRGLRLSGPAGLRRRDHGHPRRRGPACGRGAPCSGGRRNGPCLRLPQGLRAPWFGGPDARRRRRRLSGRARRLAARPRLRSTAARRHPAAALVDASAPKPCVRLRGFPVSARLDYIRDGAEIYRRSFAIIRAEADLARFRRRRRAGRGADDPRLRHDRPAPRRGPFAGLRRAGAAALRAGAPILCDVAWWPTGSPAPACRPATRSSARSTIRACPELAARWARPAPPPPWSCGATQLAGALVAVGNAPTALFRLLELLDAGAPRPAAVDRHSGRVRRRGGVEGGAGARRARAVPRRARPARRQRHGGGGRQRARQRGRVRDERRTCAAPALRRRARPRRPGLHDVARAAGVASAPTGSSHFCKRGDAATPATIADAVVPDPDREIALVYPFTTEIAADHPDYAAAIGAFYDAPPAASPPSSRPGATWPSCARAIPSSTAPSCTSGGGWRTASRSRSCRASPACRAAGRAPARRSPGATTS